MTSLKQNGYYLSEPSHYEDWHAGLKIEHYIYSAYFFSDNSKVFLAVKKNNSIFHKTDFIPDGYEIDYSIKDGIIDFHHKKGSKYEYHIIFNIQNEDVIIDKKAIKHQWTPFNKEA